MKRKPKCVRCNDDGSYFAAPPGVNTFEVPIFQLVQMLVRHRCDCPTGRALTAMTDTNAKRSANFQDRRQNP